MKDAFQIYDIGKELFSTPAYPGDPGPCKTPFLERRCLQSYRDYYGQS